MLLDQPFLTLSEEYGTQDVVYANKCLRDHLTKDYLGVAYAQGGIVALKVRGDRAGSVWFHLYDDARDTGAPEARRTAAPGCCCPAARTSTRSCCGWPAARRSWRRSRS